MPKLIEIRKLPLMEMIGILIFGFGLCFAIAGIGLAFDDERARAEKPKVQQSVEAMKDKLIEAKVTGDQIVGLLQVHKSALVTVAVYEHFLITSFLVLLSLLVSSFGFSLMLFGKLRTLIRVSTSPTQQENANGPSSKELL